MLLNLRHLLQRNRLHWASSLVLLLVVSWVLGLCVGGSMSMDAGESSVVQPAVKLMIMEPAQQMTMTATSEHDCCANVLSTVCDDTAELLVQLFEHSFIAALYVAVALLSIFCVAKKISYPVRHQRRFYPPPVYLLNCVFRH